MIIESKLKEELEEILKKNKIQSEFKIEVKDGYHHSSVCVIVGSTTFSLKDMHSGCGCVILCKYGHLPPNDYLIDLIKHVFETYKKNGVGSIITTLGQSFPDNTLLKLGFQKLSTYPNYLHGKDGNYKQSLYQIIL